MHEVFPNYPLVSLPFFLHESLFNLFACLEAEKPPRRDGMPCTAVLLGCCSAIPVLSEQGKVAITILWNMALGYSCFPKQFELLHRCFCKPPFPPSLLDPVPKWSLLLTLCLSSCSPGLGDLKQLRCHHPIRVHSCHWPQADDHPQPASPHCHQEVHSQGPGAASAHPGHSRWHPEAAAGAGLLRHGLHAEPPGLQRAGEDGAAQPALPAAHPAARALRQPGARPALRHRAVPPARRPSVWSAAAPRAQLWLRPSGRPACRARLRLRAAAGPLPGALLWGLWRQERLRSALCPAELLEGRASLSCE